MWFNCSTIDKSESLIIRRKWPSFHYYFSFNHIFSRRKMLGKIWMHRTDFSLEYSCGRRRQITSVNANNFNDIERQSKKLWKFTQQCESAISTRDKYVLIYISQRIHSQLCSRRHYLSLALKLMCVCAGFFSLLLLFYRCTMYLHHSFVVNMSSAHFCVITLCKHFNSSIILYAFW